MKVRDIINCVVESDDVMNLAFSGDIMGINTPSVESFYKKNENLFDEAYQSSEWDDDAWLGIDGRMAVFDLYHALWNRLYVGEMPSNFALALEDKISDGLISYLGYDH